ncbi:MAG: peptide-methionine (R)-S-oxide reductase MsrB [Parcubacteria group bacterium]|nr:peptide-methionine (R)-S-oxide reductase MsrB [Parcubacteria group bacterium]
MGKKLTPEQFKVLREKGTEPPFSGEFLDNNAEGMYHCAGCGAVLFKSDGKYESNAPGLVGWPSFSEVAKDGAVELRDDDSFGMHRTEVICKNCGGHLGHLFDDQESKTGKHFCINSCALGFKKQDV